MTTETTTIHLLTAEYAVAWAGDDLVSGCDLTLDPDCTIEWLTDDGFGAGFDCPSDLYIDTTENLDAITTRELKLYNSYLCSECMAASAVH